MSEEGVRSLGKVLRDMEEAMDLDVVLFWHSMPAELHYLLGCFVVQGRESVEGLCLKMKKAVHEGSDEMITISWKERRAR